MFCHCLVGRLYTSATVSYTGLILAMPSTAYTTSEIAERLSLQLHGDGAVRITHIASLQSAGPGAISFFADKKKQELLAACKASALIVPADVAALANNSQCLLVSENPYLSYARLTQLWAVQDTGQGVHAGAIVDATAEVAQSAVVGPGAVVEAGAVVAERASIGAGAFIGRDTSIGSGTRVHANATIQHRCEIGNDCEIHSGAVIGADGFGFAPADDGGWEKICQLGRVVIGDRVSVGACTSIDRGALDDTVIGDGVILDNQIQVAHNVVIGENTAIAGCTGIAGSASIGANCRIGGAVSIVGHISICDGVLVTANSFVNRSITERGSYSSGVPLQKSSTWRKNAVRLLKLDALSRDFEKLKKSVS
jgi:UDP-3-O-[3-hydroxymyristoyl] glucosamine N-acyltransferase